MSDGSEQDCFTALQYRERREGARRTVGCGGLVRGLLKKDACEVDPGGCMLEVVERREK